MNGTRLLSFVWWWNSTHRYTGSHVPNRRFRGSRLPFMPWVPPRLERFALDTMEQGRSGCLGVLTVMDFEQQRGACLFVCFLAARIGQRDPIKLAGKSRRSRLHLPMYLHLHAPACAPVGTSSSFHHGIITGKRHHVFSLVAASLQPCYISHRVNNSLHHPYPSNLLLTLSSPSPFLSFGPLQYHFLHFRVNELPRQKASRWSQQYRPADPRLASSS